VTEADWWASDDPRQMLEFLQGTGRLTDRKARLFAVACCRRIWHLLPDERSRRAVEVGERYADGQATAEEAIAAGNAAAEVSGHDLAGIPAELGWRAAQAADHVLPLPEEACQFDLVWENVATAMEGEQLVAEGAGPELLDAWSEQSVESGRPMGWTEANPGAILANLLRDLFGPLPFRPVALDPAWLAWYGGSVVRLAQRIYDERRFEWMPELADALEEAGCRDEDILGHCREQGGVHARGCWVTDLLLGKQ
jgi:hypothetical protein